MGRGGQDSSSSMKLTEGSPDIVSSSSSSSGRSESDTSLPMMGNNIVVKPRYRLSSAFRSLWNYLLAFAALADFIAAWTHQLVHAQWEKDFYEHNHHHHGHHHHHDHVPTEEEAAQHTFDPITGMRLPVFLSTIAINHINLGLIFSLFWFLDSFITARENWIKARREVDRQILLGEKVPRSWFGMDLPTLAYYRSIFFQLVTLPVGFYYFVYQVSLTYARGQDVREHFQWNHHEAFHSHEHHHDYHQRQKEIDGGVDESYETYANYSLIYAIFHLGMTHLGRMLRKEGERQTKALAVDIAKRALRRPISFGRRVKAILQYARWLKYTAPIIATSNKFFQNFKDLLKKMRQKREAYIAMRIRRRLMRERTPQERKEHAILCMQKVYRANKARKLARALRLLQGNKEVISAMKLQKRFRASLSAARQRIEQKRMELLELEERQREMEENAKTLSDLDRARMYQLQIELKHQTDFFLNKMLLRPNTRFIVWWKAAFVFAVIFEIGGKVYEPKMKKRYKSYNNMVEQHIVPQRWATLPVCNPKPIKPKLHDQVLSNIAHLFDKNNTRFDPKPAGPLPWKCSPKAMKAQGFLVSAMEFTIRRFDRFMAVVFFLDVFISFFTGELDEETGVLSPPGFFSRYILPGVLLQCIVNPEMETTAKIIKWLITEFIFLGPIRVIRWITALMVPLVLLIHSIFKNIHSRIAPRKSIRGSVRSSAYVGRGSTYSGRGSTYPSKSIKLD